MHVRSKDTVLVLSGKSRGRRGRVLSVSPAADRALVEGANMAKKHARANPRKGVKGGILEREAAIHVSNLMVICPQCGKPTRVGYERLANGRKVRQCKRCQAHVDK
jgi:large subunit ribosomal protein L24